MYAYQIGRCLFQIAAAVRLQDNSLETCNHSLIVPCIFVKSYLVIDPEALSSQGGTPRHQSNKSVKIDPPLCDSRFYCFMGTLRLIPKGRSASGLMVPRATGLSHGASPKT